MRSSVLVGETLDAAVGCCRRDLRTLFVVSAMLGFPLLYISSVRIAVPTTDEAWPLLILLRLFFSQLAIQATITAGIPVVTARLDGAVSGIVAGLRAVARRSVEVVLLTIVHVACFYLSGAIGAAVILPLMASNEGFTGRLIGYTIAIATYLVAIALVTPISLTLAVLVNEPASSLARGLARSWVLTRGSRFQIFAVFLVCNLLLYSVALGITVISRAIPGVVPSAAWWVARMLLVFLIVPIVPAAVAVIYRQLRMHREGMDLVLLQQHIGG